MKIRLIVVALFMILFTLSSCATPVVVIKGSSTETILLTDEMAPVPTKTATLEPTFTPTIEPTPTEIPTLTPTPTPEPVLWCSDVIEDCYFIGSEIARIFTVITLPCFELGGECYAPVEDCSKIPPSVVHVLVEDFAVAWEEEVTGNPEYSLLDPNLYDLETEYCFVDEGIVKDIRDVGNEEFRAHKFCLDSDDMPCDALLLFMKGVLHPVEIYRSLTLTNDNYSLIVLDRPLTFPPPIEEITWGGDTTSSKEDWFYLSVNLHIFASAAANSDVFKDLKFIIPEGIE